MSLTPEILKERKRGIGGSDIGAILGVNPYKSSRDLALEKLGLLPEPEMNSAMERGTRLESLVADLFTEKTGIEVREEKQMIVHPDHDWMLGNVDRLTVPDQAILEIKCPGMAVFSRVRREGLPMAWRAQLEWYLALSGSNTGFFAVFNSELWRLEHFQVEADPEFQSLIMSAAEKFWTDLQNGILPEDESPVIDLPAVDKSSLLRIDTPEWHKAVQELREAKEIKDEAETLYEAAKTDIQRQMNGAYCAESVGFRAYMIQSEGRKTIDAKKLEKQFPEAYKACLKNGKPSTSFRPFFNVKGQTND